MLVAKPPQPRGSGTFCRVLEDVARRAQSSELRHCEVDFKLRICPEDLHSSCVYVRC